MSTRDTRESDSGFVIESDILPIINEDGSERQSQNGKQLLIYVQCNLDSVTLNLGTTCNSVAVLQSMSIFSIHLIHKITT